MSSSYNIDGSVIVTSLVLLALIALTLWWQRRAAARSSTLALTVATQEREQLAVALRAVQEHSAEVEADRSRLEASVVAATAASHTLQSALQQLTTDVSDRLLQQQSAAFAQTSEALEQRASTEVRTMREILERASAERAEAQLAPIAEALARVEGELGAARAGDLTAATRVEALLQTLADEQRRHWHDTRQLQGAFRSAQIRGQFGEFTLVRALEEAGLREGVHFVVQGADRDEAGGFRPDVVIRLPGERSLVVDSKAPMEHLLTAQGADDADVRRTALQQHARALRRHIDQLADKAYPRRVQASTRVAPETAVWTGVLLFVPSDTVLDVALRRDATLLRHAAQRRVFLVSPTTLLVVLNTVEQLWRQDQLGQQAARIVALGSQLYERLALVVRHVDMLGTALTRSVNEYNGLVGSLESRLVPAARGLRDTGLRLQKELPELATLTDAVRTPSPRLQQLMPGGPAETPAASPADTAPPRQAA